MPLARRRRRADDPEKAMLLNAEVSNRTLLVRADQHFAVAKVIRSLHVGTTAAEKNQQEAAGRLQALEQRLQALRTLHDDGPRENDWVDEQVNRDVLYAVRDGHARGFQRCALCEQKILRRLFAAHEERCQRMMADAKAKAEEELDRQREAEYYSAGKTRAMARCPHCGKNMPSGPTLQKHVARCKKTKKSPARNKAPQVRMAPRAPTALGLLKASSSSLSVAWTAPILDGGCPIVDYELTFSRVLVVKTGTRETREVQPPQTMSTSIWCKAAPVARTGFTLTGLAAGTEYVNFTVRCRNEVGFSPPSEPLDSASTLDATPPSKPVLFRAMEVSARKIRFEWCEPHDSGGCPIDEYEIRYSVAVRIDDLEDGVPQYEEQQLATRTGSDELEFMLTGLIGGTDYKNVTVCALNHAGFASKPSNRVPVVRTSEPSQLELFEQEYERALAHRKAVIDSSLYTGGIVRYTTEDFVERLREDIREQREELGLEDHEEAGMHLMGEDPDRDVDVRNDAVSEEDLIDQAYPGYKTRKAQFQYRLMKLSNQLNAAEERRVSCFTERAKLSNQMSTAQLRIQAVQNELDLIAPYRGEFIDSSTLHGHVERFKRDQLNDALRDELESRMDEIAACKKGFIRLEVLKEDMIARIAETREEIEDRKAKLQLFETEARRKLRHSDMVNRQKAMNMQFYWRRWQELVAARRNLRDVITRAAFIVDNQELVAAFGLWKRTALEEEEELAEEEETVGLGSMLMVRAEHRRKEIGDGIEATLHLVSGVRGALKLSRYSAVQKDSLRKSLFFPKTANAAYAQNKPLRDQEGMLELHHGDAYMDNGDVELALDHYARHVAHVSAQEDGKLRHLAQAYGRVAGAHAELLAYDTAIVNYDRAQALAREAEDTQGQADAAEGLGDCYLAKNNYQLAGVMFMSALSHRLELYDQIGEARACRGLQACYERQHNKRAAKHYEHRAIAIEQERMDKLEHASSTLTKLHKKLVGTTAEASAVVTLERITAQTMQLRAQRARMLQRKAEIQEDLEERLRTRAGIQELLDACVAQLEVARTARVTSMESELIHGSSALFEIEELKMMLGAKIESTRAKLHEADQGVRTLRVQISNIDDDNHEVGANMEIEEGDLARRVGVKPLRLFCLHTANAHSNNVMGTSTGGVEMVGAAIEKDVHVYSLKTGLNLAIFPGEAVRGGYGHESTVLCLCFDETRLYSGACDKTLRIWDCESFTRCGILRGHTASVTAVAVDHDTIVTGGADTRMILWDKESHRRLHIVHGHKKSITAINIFGDVIMTGEASGVARVWSKSARTVRHVLKGPHAGVPLTSVAFAKMESVTADRRGRIAVWDTLNHEVLQEFTPHEGAVTQLQFDATKVVSGGADGVVHVTDIATGETVETLRGHEGSVLAVQFDNVMALSASADGTLRYWRWKGGRGGASRDKMHIVDIGENARSIAKHYRVKMADLQRWNNLDNTTLYVGMRIVVKRGKR